MFIAIQHLLRLAQQEELLLRQIAAKASDKSSVEFFANSIGDCNVAVLGVFEAGLLWFQMNASPRSSAEPTCGTNAQAPQHH